MVLNVHRNHNTYLGRARTVTIFSFSPCCIFPVHSTSFFPDPLPFSPCTRCGWYGFQSELEDSNKWPCESSKQLVPVPGRASSQFVVLPFASWNPGVTHYMRLYSHKCIQYGRFSEAGLHEWMPFVIIRARSRERSQRHFRADFWVGIASRCV